MKPTVELGLAVEFHRKVRLIHLKTKAGLELLELELLLMEVQSRSVESGWIFPNRVDFRG